MRTLVGRILMTVALPAALFMLWWYTSAGSDNFYLPPLQRILEAFGDTWTWPRLRSDVLPSLARLAVGYTGAVLLGIGMGVVIGLFPKARAGAEPVLEFFRAIPPPVLVPVIMLFAGIGDSMKVVVIISGCVWPVLLNTVEGVRAVDEVLDSTCQVYRVTGFARLRYLILRSASPQIVTGMRQGLSIAIILMVISEMFAASEGLGFTIVQFQRSFAIPEMWSGILLLGLLGVALSLLFQLAERRVLAWYRGLRHSQRS